MRTDQVQNVTKSVRQMSATVAVNGKMHQWVREMALPLVSEHKVKGALRDVHRRTGVSFSKLRKFFYGWECAEPKASEYIQTRQAYLAWMVEHRARLKARLDEIEQLREEMEAGELQLGLGL